MQLNWFVEQFQSFSYPEVVKGSFFFSFLLIVSCYSYYNMEYTYKENKNYKEREFSKIQNTQKKKLTLESPKALHTPLT